MLPAGRVLGLKSWNLSASPALHGKPQGCPAGGKACLSPSRRDKGAVQVSELGHCHHLPSSSQAASLWPWYPHRIPGEPILPSAPASVPPNPWPKGEQRCKRKSLPPLSASIWVLFAEPPAQTFPSFQETEALSTLSEGHKLK